ncbi:MAG: hypothetical protein AB8B56_11895 [Crocinitomicaceae bacterium]
MRLLLFILLSSHLSIAQYQREVIIPFDDSVSVESEVLGDWTLAETEIINGYHYFEDSIRLQSTQFNRKIWFGVDSLRVYPDTSLRFYHGGIRSYTYRFEYDSLFRSTDLKLFEGKKRKKREIANYEVVKCTQNELILKSHEFTSYALDLASYTIFYTYRREGVDSLLSKLSGDWYTCSKETQPFLYSKVETDKAVIKFTKLEDSVNCTEHDHHIHLDFYRHKNKNLCSVSTWRGFAGSAAITPVLVDSKNNLIDFGAQDGTLYRIAHLSEDELILKEETKIDQHKKIPSLSR